MLFRFKSSNILLRRYVGLMLASVADGDPALNQRCGKVSILFTGFIIKYFNTLGGGPRVRINTAAFHV